MSKTIACCIRMPTSHFDHMRQIAHDYETRTGRKTTWADLNRWLVRNYLARMEWRKEGT
jgi:hypothetical protein